MIDTKIEYSYKNLSSIFFKEIINHEIFVELLIILFETKKTIPWIIYDLNIVELLLMILLFWFRRNKKR